MLWVLNLIKEFSMWDAFFKDVCLIDENIYKILGVKGFIIIVCEAHCNLSGLLVVEFLSLNFKFSLHLSIYYDIICLSTYFVNISSIFFLHWKKDYEYYSTCLCSWTFIWALLQKENLILYLLFIRFIDAKYVLGKWCVFYPGLSAKI